MTLQTDLQDAVACIQADSKIFNKIVHGDSQTTVTTDGGDIKSASKTIKDLEDSIQAQLTDLGTTSGHLSDTVSQAEMYRNEAQASAQSARNAAHALNLPTNIKGQAGRFLAVKQAENGFETIKSAGVFYGLRADGAKLTAITGQGSYSANDFDTWFITLPGVNFDINEDGHLIINI